MISRRRQRRAREAWAGRAPAEHVRAGLAAAPEETLREIRALVADDPPGVGAESWYEILTAVFGYGDQQLAREVFAVFERRVDDGSPLAAERDSLRPWVAADADSPSAPPPPGGRRTVAIMDYGHPGSGRASANIGDHIQSIAALGHLVRHRGVRLHGDEQLVRLLEELGSRTRPELRRDDVDADLEVITVHRDASMYQPIAEGTWVLCFGWYMHALFEMRHGFPLHRNLRPIFVSFHCNKRGLLTPDAIEYLRRHGPIGCRDWSTVYLLQSCGVPAFFSGCVTTTIDAAVPARVAARGRAGRIRRHAGRAGASGRGHVRAQRPRGPAPRLRRERAPRARPARHLCRPPQRGRHLAAALLPAGQVDRGARRVPADEPLRHPLRRP